MDPPRGVTGRAGSLYPPGCELRTLDDTPTWWMWDVVPRMRITLDGLRADTQCMIVIPRDGARDDITAVLAVGDRTLYYASAADEPVCVTTAEYPLAQVPGQLHFHLGDAYIDGYTLYVDGHRVRHEHSSYGGVSYYVRTRADIVVEARVGGTLCFGRVVVM